MSQSNSGFRRIRHGLSLGLGTCWIRAYGTANEQGAKKILNIPEEERPLSIIAIGHPAESPEKTRRCIEEITFDDRYGRR